MISEAGYLCGGQCPAQATMACVQQGCYNYALCCSQSNCDCRTNHRTHDMKMLVRIFEVVMAPVKLPEHVAKIEKDINMLIDKLVYELQLLKANHKQHVKQHLDKHIGENTLLSKLTSRQQLDPKAALGNSFYELLITMKRMEHLPSPYSASSSQLEKAFVALEAEAKTTRLKIEQLWKFEVPASQRAIIRSQPNMRNSSQQLPVQIALSEQIPQKTAVSNYQFGSSLKYKDIQLKEINRRAILPSGSSFGLALVYPSLTLSAPSKIIFRVNKMSGALCVGVCYKNQVENPKYLPILFETSQGLYMHGNKGHIYSDSVATDNDTQISPLRFDTGDFISVELQPAAGRIVYSMKSGSFSQKSAITTTTTSPINFVVWLYSNCDVSICERQDTQ